MAKSNLDRIQRHLENIQDLVGPALNDLDAAKYESLFMILEEIVNTVNKVMIIMENNKEFDF
jgi:hypothetical protein